MCKRLLGIVMMICSFHIVQAQNNKGLVKVGFAYGRGSEFKNRNYSYSNEYIKLQYYYKFKVDSNFSYELMVQPEVNFGQHQLLNLFFVKPTESDFIEKRDTYTKLKRINDYVLNVGLVVRKEMSSSSSVYLVGSVGPLITDTETERLSKGFAFSDVLGVGFTYRVHSLSFDFRPNIRHVSNAGLQKKNSGYNTKNIEFGILYSL